MNDYYLIHRHADLQFFDWLSKLNPSSSGQIASLNKQLFCTYVAYDALSTWADDRVYRLPSNFPQVEELTYFSGDGKRIFCAALYAQRQKALLFEVFPLQLMMLPYGVCNEGGQEYQPTLSFALHLPDDKRPVSNIFTLKNDGCGLMLSEEAVPEPLRLDDQPHVTPRPPQTRLRIDACLPDLVSVQFNLSPVLDSILQGV